MPRMTTPREAPQEPTYSLGAVARLTGLSEHVLRAWERRYGAVQPLRTPGGTRRYREGDVVRLRLLGSAVASGHAIGEIARLPDAEIERRLDLAIASLPRPALAPVLAALEALDGPEAERLLGAQLAALGGARFVRAVASPLLVEIGGRWARGGLCVASEHLASTILRNLLGSCLRPRLAGARAPAILFTTPPGERHELGALMAAVTSVEAGGHPVFLGPDLPIPEVAAAVRSLDAAVVALGVCQADGAARAAAFRELRRSVPPGVDLWVGGPAAPDLELPPGVTRLADLDELDGKVALLGVRGSPA
jgi:DNA-binding transcriptional MerR regulator